MKILYIASADRFDGSNIAMLNIIEQIKDKVDVRVVFAGSKGEVSEQLEKWDVGTYHLLYMYHNYQQKNNVFRSIFATLHILTANHCAVKKLCEICTEFKPDIIHSNNGITSIGYKAAKRLNIPHVWHLREYIDKDFQMHPFPSFKSYTKQYLDSCNHCIAITKGVFDYFNLNNNSIQLYDGPISEKPTYKKDKLNYFLFAGRLSRSKGALALIEAYIDYHNKGGETELWLAGEPQKDIKDRIVRLINDNELTSKVKLLGFRNDTFDLMAQAKALFVPSLFEGFGFITAEAMYNHCLVVGRNTAGTKEQFDNGLQLQGSEIALRFEKDVEMSDIMWDINKQDYSHIVELAYKTVTTLYSKEKNAQRLLLFYDSVLTKTKI